MKTHVHLYPIDVSFDELKAMSNDEEMNPALLNHKELRKDVLGVIIKL